MHIHNGSHKRVLIVAYAFPPVGGAGVQRPAKFVKYLGEFGWKPEVLTCANPSVPVVDDILAKEIPADVPIHKAKTFEPSYERKASFVDDSVDTATVSFLLRIKSFIKTIVGHLLIPDVQVLWWPALVFRLVKILRRGHIDCVFVTAPPFSSLLPVVIFCNLYKVPVVADFRDEWSFLRKNIENASRNTLVENIDLFLERTVVRLADAIAVASEQYLVGIASRHPNIDTSEKGIVITNGYDDKEFEGIKKKQHPDNKPLQIVYSGTVWSATSLKNFSMALELLLKEWPDLKKMLSVKILGRVVGSEKCYLLKGALVNVVSLEGYCSHQQVLSEIVNADVLLLTLADTEGADRIIPAKTFEYMATGNKILAIIPDGEVKNILSMNYPNALIVDPANVQGIKTVLRQLIEQFENKPFIQLSGIQLDKIKQFSRRNLSKKLAKLLDYTVESDH